jgi:hypothetical protein
MTLVSRIAQSPPAAPTPSDQKMWLEVADALRDSELGSVLTSTGYGFLPDRRVGLVVTVHPDRDSPEVREALMAEIAELAPGMTDRVHIYAAKFEPGGEFILIP